jgi:hypothetical protein
VTCLVCGGSPTIKAHLIPQAFTREVRGNDTDLANVTRSGNFRPAKNGFFDTRLLCKACDGQLGGNEKFAVESLQRLRELTPSIVNANFDVVDFDTERFLRFCAGIIWKYASTRKHLGRLEIGPYLDTLKAIAFYGYAIPPEVDAFIVRLHSGDNESYFYGAPLSSRHGGVNFVRFSVGGVIIFLKLDKRPSPSPPPAEFWLRGRRSFCVTAAPFDAFEEGKMALSLRSKNPALDNFLRNAHRST